MSMERRVLTETGAVVVERDILPVFVVRRGEPIEPLSLEGSGFLLGSGLFITCWHCVAKKLEPNLAYAAVVPLPNNQYAAAILVGLERDRNGGDLATAKVPLSASIGLSLAANAADYGADVWSFGFPLTGLRQARPAGGQSIAIDGRYLQGYVTRTFYYDHPELGRVPSYELDMPAPQGLSGAPLILVGTRSVIGVIYGSNDVATVEQFAAVNPETGEREPEVQRITSFGLACFTDSLASLSGEATDGRPLRDFLTSRSDPRST